MMSQDLRYIESRALQAQTVGQYRVAIKLWRDIIEIQPNWEHGYAHYNLANCYASVGEFEKAEEAYRLAIELEPQNEMFSIALQSLVDARRSGAI